VSLSRLPTLTHPPLSPSRRNYRTLQAATLQAATLPVGTLLAGTRTAGTLSAGTPCGRANTSREAADGRQRQCPTWVPPSLPVIGNIGCLTRHL